MDHTKDIGNKKLPAEKLRALLQTYFLSSANSPMESVIEEITRAYQFELPVYIYGTEDSSLNDIKDIVSSLGIIHKVVMVQNSKSKPEGLEREYKFRKIRAPELTERSADLNRLIRLLFQKNIAELQSKYPTKVEKIEILFLALLREESGLGKSINSISSLDGAIRDAILEANNGIISINHVNFSDLSYNGQYLYNLIRRGMHKRFIMYMGFHLEEYSDNDIPFESRSRNHAVNRIVRVLRSEAKRWNDEQIAQGQIDYLNDLNHPLLKRFIMCDIKDIGAVLENIAYLEHVAFCEVINVPDPSKDVYKCLEMRLLGFCEVEICRKLGHGDNVADFVDWTKQNHIALQTELKDDLSERWQGAKEALGIKGQESTSYTIAINELQNNGGEKPILEINCRTNTIMINGKKHFKYKAAKFGGIALVLRAASVALEHCKKISYLRQPYFDRTKLCSDLGFSKDRKIASIFRGTIFWPGENNRGLVRKIPGKNRYTLEIDIKNSRIERQLTS